MNFYFFIFEFGITLLLTTVFFHERKNRKMMEILFLAFLYGIFLEIINVHMSGLYFYGKDFYLNIFDVPVAIGAGWAIVYYISFKVSENYNFAWWQSPFLMALIALSFDLVMDVVAIRIGFWGWKIPLWQEWYGVPYDNFFGWLAVVWTFSLFINLSFQDFLTKNIAKAIRYLSFIISSLLLGIQIMLFVNLSAILSGNFNLKEVTFLYQKGIYDYAYTSDVQVAKGYLLLFIISSIVIFCFLRIQKNKKAVIPKDNNFVFSLSLFIHLLFLFFIFRLGIYKTLFVPTVVSLLLFFSHLFFGFWGSKNSSFIGIRKKITGG